MLLSEREQLIVSSVLFLVAIVAAIGMCIVYWKSYCSTCCMPTIVRVPVCQVRRT